MLLEFHLGTVQLWGGGGGGGGGGSLPFTWPVLSFVGNWLRSHSQDSPTRLFLFSGNLT